MLGAMHALLLMLTGLVVLYAVYKVTIHALACLIAIAAGQFAYATGAGAIGAIIVGLLTAGAASGLLRGLYLAGPAPLRWLAALFVVAASAIFAYFLFDDLSAGNVLSEIWRQALCGIGAALAGAGAFAKLAEGEDGRTSEAA